MGLPSEHQRPEAHATRLLAPAHRHNHPHPHLLAPVVVVFEEEARMEHRRVRQRCAVFPAQQSECKFLVKPA